MIWLAQRISKNPITTHFQVTKSPLHSASNSSVKVDPPRLVDIEGLNDRESDTLSSAHSSSADFAQGLVQRDGTCVLINADREVCDAAHLIPLSKGDAVSLFLSYFDSISVSRNSDLTRKEISSGRSMTFGMVFYSGRESIAYSDVAR
jgi:hypothetical protein